MCDKQACPSTGSAFFQEKKKKKKERHPKIATQIDADHKCGIETWLYFEWPCSDKVWMHVVESSIYSTSSCSVTQQQTRSFRIIIIIRAAQNPGGLGRCSTPDHLGAVCVGATDATQNRRLLMTTKSSLRTSSDCNSTAFSTRIPFRFPFIKAWPLEQSNSTRKMCFLIEWMRRRIISEIFDVESIQGIHTHTHKHYLETLRSNVTFFIRWTAKYLYTMKAEGIYR